MGNEGDVTKERELLPQTAQRRAGCRLTWPLRRTTSRMCLVGYLTPAVELANGFHDTTERTGTDAKT